RDEPLRLERGIAGRLRAEGVEMRGEVTVHAERLQEGHGGADAAEELVVDDFDLADDRRRLRRRLYDCRRGVAVAAAVRLQQPLEAGLRREQLRRCAL